MKENELLTKLYKNNPNRITVLDITVKKFIEESKSRDLTQDEVFFVQSAQRVLKAIREDDNEEV
jgi:hypothetical protein